MKHWPPLPSPLDAPQVRRRIPAFHPVPVGARKDGWTPSRQAAFIGLLAQTRSVEGACRALSMGKESAYRLRKRPGAAGFAAAWDAALGKPRSSVDLTSTKSTGLDAGYRHQMGLLQVVMERGRFVGTHWKNDDNALLQHLAQLDRSLVEADPHTGKPRRLELPDASRESVDFGGAEAAGSGGAEPGYPSEGSTPHPGTSL